MIVSSYITPKAAKGRPSDISGRGLIATDAIAAGEVVAIKGGHIVDSATLSALPERLQNSGLQIADGFHLVAVEDEEYEPVMLFLNHSCEPNVGFAGNIVLVALREIAAGEELTTDYALFDDYDGEMPCQCGTPSCRRMVGGRDWQRPELQRRYGRYFSWYLLRRFAPGPPTAWNARPPSPQGRLPTRRSPSRGPLPGADQPRLRFGDTFPGYARESVPKSAAGGPNGR